MTTKFTPGPWTFSPQNGGKGCCLAAQVWGSDGSSLAFIETTEDPEEATSVARLIAAAPDLYEALEYQERMQNGDARCELQTFLHLRDSAIKKACGEL